MTTPAIDGHTDALRTILKSQYHAALAMLREAIERCPDGDWASEEHVNAFWQHHMAQLADRLRSSADIGIQWVGSRRR